MVYIIHQTEGYVLKSVPRGEANRHYNLLTEKLGLIQATAQGVRHLKSKLRYSLSDFARTNLALVRGKDTWRIVNASKQDDLFFDFSTEYIEIFYKFFSLIERLITGELAEPLVFSLTRSSQIFAFENPDLSKEELAGFESVMIFQLLYYLGYIGENDVLNKYKGQSWSKELLRSAHDDRKKIIYLINETLRETGL